jgi:ankyrin repeat protein
MGAAGLAERRAIAPRVVAGMSDIETLIEAAKIGDLGKVRAMLADNFLLASQRAPSGESPLMTALYRGHHDVVAAIIDAGAEIDVFASAATGRVDDLRHRIRHETVNAYAYDGWTPLHLAAFFGHLDAARLLLDSGADLHAVSRNSLRNTPLHAATAGKHTGVAMVLLEHGADPLKTDAGGYTALEIARQNQLDAVVAAISPDRR